MEAGIYKAIYKSGTKTDPSNITVRFMFFWLSKNYYLLEKAVHNYYTPN